MKGWGGVHFRFDFEGKNVKKITVLWGLVNFWCFSEKNDSRRIFWKKWFFDDFSKIFEISLKCHSTIGFDKKSWLFVKNISAIKDSTIEIAAKCVIFDVLKTIIPWYFAKLYWRTTVFWSWNVLILGHFQNLVILRISLRVLPTISKKKTSKKSLYYAV